MNISPVSYNNFSFKSALSENHQPKQEKNPVSAAGEKADLAKAAFVAGAGLGGRLLFELVDGGFVLDDIGKKAGKIVSKQKNLTENQRAVKELGVMAGLVLSFIAGVAALYTLFKAPEINYQGNINAMKNKKDMDVYIKGNNVEKELYSQMLEKSKNADDKEKAKLREQYMQMQAAKNLIPEFVNR